jgi:hypothetical protein
MPNWSTRLPQPYPAPDGVAGVERSQEHGVEQERGAAAKPSRRRRRRNAEPLGITVNEALERGPWGRTKLYELLDSGRLKSKKVDGKRIIDYASFKALVIG